MSAIAVYDKLIGHFGTLTDTAKALNVTPSVVDNWRVRGIPRGRALDIEEATGGAITARDVLAARAPQQQAAA